MKLIAIIFIASAHLIASSVGTDGIAGCKFSNHPQDVPKPYLKCTDLQLSFLPFRKSYAKAKSLRVAGNFSRFLISTRYKKLKHLTIQFNSAVNNQFNFYNYRKLRRFRSVLLYTQNLYNLNFTGVEKQKWLEDFQLQNIGGHAHVSSCQGLKRLTKMKTLALGSVTTFDMSCAPVSLQSFGIQFHSSDYLVSAESLRELTNLRLISIYSANFTFDLGNLPSRLHGIDLMSQYGISEFRGCERLKTLTNVVKVRLARFPPNILHCLPPNLSTLIVEYNDDVTSIGDCESLLQLRHLQKVDMSRNNLQTFNFSCLPDKMSYLDISYNQITHIDFKEVWNSTNLDQLTTYAIGNPINCTCQFIIDWFRVEAPIWDSNQDEPCKDNMCCTFNCVSCSVDSQLAHYPWSKTIEALTDFDASPSQYQCLSVYDYDY